MKNTIFSPTTVILAFAISLCIFNLWNISELSIDDSKIKSDMVKYIPQQTPAPEKQPVNKANTSNARSESADAHPEPLHNPQDAEALISDSAAAEIVNVENPEMKLLVNPFIITMQMETNADIVAWINIPDTNIDYPIVQAADNDFYLRRNLYREDAVAGSIFMDYRCDAELAHYNTIIYGHNMKNHSMFGDLRLFADPGFFEENQYGTLFTAFGTYVIRFFAFMVISSDDGQIYMNPPSPEVFHDYIKENARIYREPENYGKVITLSTCSYEYENARGVLIAYICD